jgi:hypothetical protein
VMECLKSCQCILFRSFQALLQAWMLVNEISVLFSSDVFEVRYYSRGINSFNTSDANLYFFGLILKDLRL